MAIQISTLNDIKENGEKYIYDLEPQQNNLFIVTKFSDPFKAKGADGDTTGDFDGDNWIQYQIKSISFDGDQLSFDENYQNNMFRAALIQDLQFVKSVKIEWIEDVYHRVYNYHRTWLNSWYSREMDMIPVGMDGKFRNLEVSLFHYVNTNTTSFSPILTPEYLGTITVTGLIPEKIPDFSVGYESNGNETAISLTYRCSQAYYQPTKVEG